MPGYERLIHSLTKLQFKPDVQKETKRYILKLPLFCASQIHMIQSALPQIKLILSVRHIKPSFLSFAKVLRMMKDNPEKKGDFWFYSLNLPYDDEKLKVFL